MLRLRAPFLALAALALVALSPAARVPWARGDGGTLARAQDAPVPGWRGRILPDRGLVAARQAALDLTTDGRLLAIACHPDDEDGQTLVTYRHERGIETAVVVSNRGEGGQNQIGPELGPELAVIRTREMERAAAIQGTRRVYWLNQIDFGFSKSAAETFARWGREETLRRLVRVIRDFRPHVIVTNHDDAHGHGHHRAVGILAREAFRLAGDASRFPELGAPWQPLRYFQIQQPDEPEATMTVTVPVYRFDWLRGLTHAQIAHAALREHRSQGTWERAPWLVGPRRYRLLYSRAAADRFPATREAGAPYRLPGLFAGITTRETIFGGLGGIDAAQLEAFAPVLADLAALVSFRQAGTAGAVPPPNGTQVRRLLARFPGASAAIEARLAPLSRQGVGARLALRVKQWLVSLGRRLARAVATEAGLTLQVAYPMGRAYEAVAGETFALKLRLTRGRAPLVLRGAQPAPAVTLTLPSGWTATRVPDAGGDGPAAPEGAPGSAPDGSAPATNTRPAAERPLVYRYRVSVPADATPTVPRRETQYREAWRRPPIRARAALAFAARAAPGSAAAPTAPAAKEPALAFELRAPVFVDVLPRDAVTVEAAPGVVFANGRGVTTRVKLTLAHRAAVAATFTLTPSPPPGATVIPTERTLSFSEPGTQVATFAFKFPSTFVTGTPTPPRTATARVRVSTPDAEPRRLAYTWPVTVVKVAPVRVGLVESYDTTLAQALEALGVRFSRLTRATLASGDLSAYDTIVTDIRAYLQRKDLREFNARLLDFARAGGHLVVTYNKLWEFNEAEGNPCFAPYPLALGRMRVTLEDAPVTVLVPRHPLFTRPNAITKRDWDGWVQERGLYFPKAWDPAYLPLLQMNDPGEPAQRGAQLFARLGKGSYVYTALVWYRQLRVGHPGAFRLFANLISYPKVKDARDD